MAGLRVSIALAAVALLAPACADDEPDEPVLRIDRPASVDRDQLEDGAGLPDEVVARDGRAG